MAKRERPTTNPKDQKSVNVRMDRESIDILNDYCDKKGVSHSKAIRTAIKELKTKKDGTK